MPWWSAWTRSPQGQAALERAERDPACSPRCPGTERHVECDNYVTLKHTEVRKWLAANPRVSLRAQRSALAHR